MRRRRYDCTMRKKHRSMPPSAKARSLPPRDLPPVQRACLTVLQNLRAEQGREPTVAEVSAALGLSRGGARELIEWLIERGHYVPRPVELNARQLQCLRAIADLEARLGSSPTTRQVSAEMGMSEGGSRIHITALAEYGLITPPKRVLVMGVTEAGKKRLGR
jgi:DNA-directed RNA polymerase specialized sigma subunit